MARKRKSKDKNTPRKNKGTVKSAVKSPQQVIPLPIVEREFATLSNMPKLGVHGLPWQVDKNIKLETAVLSDAESVLQTCFNNAVKFWNFTRAISGTDGPGIYGNATIAIPLRVISVDISKIFPIHRKIEKLSNSYLEKIVRECAYYMGSSLHHFRQRGFRILLTAHKFDLGNPKVMNFLTNILLSSQGSYPFGFRIYLSYSALLAAHDEIPDYRLYLNTAFFSVINDVEMDNEAALDYLLFCHKNNLPYVQDMSKVNQPNKFINANKKHIWRSPNALIIIDREFKSSLDGLQKCALENARLAQYADLLIRRIKS